MITLLALTFIQQVSASSFYKQLCSFNFNWTNYGSHISDEAARDFFNDAEYVQAHLTEVLKMLRTNSTVGLNKKQLAQRTSLINELEVYKNRGLFPQNYYRLERIPVFIDEHGTHCAVGHLLQFSGYDHIAQRIAKTDNYIWVKDIKDQDVIEWQIQSGLTFEELKIIQGAYDSYLDGAFFHPNKYEIPQKPEPIIAYFEGVGGKGDLTKDAGMVWCRGEGKNGVMHGKWEQNAAKDIPWIVGYFNHGQRTGQWKEYYQGTKQLCRTENWRNDKLNGVRKRFDREGKLIEEITFKDGDAVTKVNYDFNDKIKFIRTPIDSNLVYTEIFTFGGGLLASGVERIHNPGNLLWFQNIELTALNSASITSRDNGLEIQGLTGNGFSRNLYNIPPLVQYKKEGDWVFYKQFNEETMSLKPELKLENAIQLDYAYYANELLQVVNRVETQKLKSTVDSIRIEYKDNQVQDLYAFGEKIKLHLSLEYHPLGPRLPIYHQLRYRRHRYDWGTEPQHQLKSIGSLDEKGYKTGVWNHYDHTGKLAKTENYIIPWKEEETDVSLITH